MPHVDPRDAVAVALDECPELPFLPELPGRGPGADMAGRTASLLVDLPVDLQPSGWRLVDRLGMDGRRARAHLSADLDELEAGAASYVGPLKVQVTGPWTLAAALRLPRGEPVLSDRGAVSDVVASLAEGVAAHVADVARRLPGASVLLQVDEPSLPAVLAGDIRYSSGARQVAAVAPSDAEVVLRTVVTAARVPVVAHCCAARPPVALLAAAGAAGLSLDMTLLGEESDDALAEALEAGSVLLAGLVPTLPGAGPLSAPADTVAPVRRTWRRLGLDPAQLRSVVVTPTCGLAGTDPQRAVAALRSAAAAARQLADDPEG
jgi:methionine synthase II (cobalamin-independent)